MELLYDDPFFDDFIKEEKGEEDYLTVLPVPVLLAVMMRHLHFKDVASLFRCNTRLRR